MIEAIEELKRIISDLRERARHDLDNAEELARLANFLEDCKESLPNTASSG